MPGRNPIQAFYAEHPRMVSSPFGGVDVIRRELFLEVLRQLGIALGGRRVLDVGCGRGYAGEVVAAQGGSYTGLDFVVSRTGFRLVRGDAACLPFGAGAFDVVLCLDAAEHFPNPGRAAAEIQRVLKPGGVFFLSAPNYGNVAGLVKWVCERWGGYAANTWAPFGRWQPQEFEQFVTPGRVRRIGRAAGFRRIRGVGYGTEVGLGLFPWIDHRKMPESIQFRLQRLFRWIGPGIAWFWPRTSLHIFWRMEK